MRCTSPHSAHVMYPHVLLDDRQVPRLRQPKPTSKFALPSCSCPVSSTSPLSRIYESSPIDDRTKTTRTAIPIERLALASTPLLLRSSIKAPIVHSLLRYDSPKSGSQPRRRRLTLPRARPATCALIVPHDAASSCLRRSPCIY